MQYQARFQHIWEEQNMANKTIVQDFVWDIAMLGIVAMQLECAVAFENRAGMVVLYTHF